MLINQTKVVQVEAKTLSIHMKVRDGFCGDILDQDGEKIGGQEDVYVPDFMPGEHYGDYLILDIDLMTGRIVNWQPPTAVEIQRYIAGSEADEY